MAAAKKPLDLLSPAQLRGRETKDSHRSPDQSFALGRPAADGVVLGQDDPVVLAGISQPDLVSEVLSSILSIDIRHRMEGQTRGTYSVDAALTQAAVDEHLGGLFALRSGHRRRLSDAAAL